MACSFLIAAASGAVDEATFEDAFNSSADIMVRMIFITYWNVRRANIYSNVKHTT